MQRCDPVGALRRFAQQHPAPWVLAVSGGRDSMALLEAAKRLGKPFDVATVNHGMRPEAAREVELVQRAWPQTRVIALKPPRKPSLAWAREARYDALLRYANGRLLLTAHHRDDWVETLFFQLLRGTTPDAWATFDRPGVARPFLSVARADLEHFVAKHRVAYLDDPSNRDTAHPRTMLREQVIPLLHTFAPPDWESRMCRFAEDVAIDAAHVSSLTPRMGKVLKVAELPPAVQRRATWQWLKRLAPSVQRHHIEATLQLLTASSDARVRLPGGVMLRRRGHGITVVAEKHLPVAPTQRIF